MRNKYDAPHVLFRDGIYYYVRRIPHDLTTFYSVKRLCFSLKTKSCVSAKRLSTSVTQRLDDYWLGLRLQNMDIPAIQLVKTDDKIAEDTTPLLSDALELYISNREKMMTAEVYERLERAGLKRQVIAKVWNKDQHRLSVTFEYQTQEAFKEVERIYEEVVSSSAFMKKFAIK